MQLRTSKLLAASLILLAPALSHASNTINFIGEVSEQTCAVTINGNTNLPAVLLPTASTGALNASGNTSGQTNFRVTVSGCAAPTAAVPIRTVFVGNNVTSNGYLGNTGTAGNVALQLLDPATPAAPFNLNTTEGYRAAGLQLAVGATSASYDYAVRYIANGAAATAATVRYGPASNTRSATGNSNHLPLVLSGRAISTGRDRPSLLTSP